MQFSGYFLIVWDFIRYAKEHNIPVGPGRGSAAGSLVAYALSHHRHRSPAERAAVRALPESRAHQHARHRHRLLHEPSRRGHRLRHAEVRPRPGGADHHLRHHGGEGGDEGFRPRHGHSVRRRGSHRQDDAADAEHHHRSGAEGFAAAGRGLRQRAADEGADRHREEARRAGAQLGRARRRRGDLAASRSPTWCRCIAPRTTKS